MKLQQLECLVAVVDHGSIRAAARHLHLSQAAVTKSMRLLEEDAGTALLLRRSRGVDITEAGRRLVARARIITRQVALARDDLGQTAGDDGGTLRVGINPVVSLTVLGETFNWFRQRYRNVQVEFTDGLMMRVLPRLRDGTLDLAVVVADAGESFGEGLHVERLRRIRQRVTVRRGHPAIQSPSAAKLVGYEWIFTRPMSSDRQQRLTAMFTLAGVTAPGRIVVCDALQAFELQRNSDALSIMPEPLLGKPETRDIVALDESGLLPYDLELMLLTRPDVPLTPAAEYFAHCIAEMSRSPKLAQA